MKIHFLTAAALAAAVLPIALAGPAGAAAPDIKVKTGQGLGACPAETLCVYETENYNATKPGRIWLLTRDSRQSEQPEWNLKGHQAEKRGRSAYNHQREWMATLRQGHTLAESTEVVMMPRGAKLPSLNGVDGAHGGRKVTHKRVGGSEGRVDYEFRDATVNLVGRLGSAEMFPSVTTSGGTR
ncbi:peptidase inhibitor family I36 protein [Streptomyces sp. ZAF1911]|uniref:peptidase inhibitor family I36 protein n=1 Tax=Streptomyces sp. ZAF1911 TaxID=2944129 RepID=UPI00237B928F|nr:peptidase inhibitor family I36 protein [Streptomyces sp. ZAF1911]MDD9383091.1 peptidase inhibitor family I36 protein [Streptomyces sp. ZAF1911]